MNLSTLLPRSLSHRLKLLTLLWLGIALHLAAIAFYRLVRKQNLVRPMIVGDKDVPHPVPASADTAGRRWFALVVLVACAAAVYGIVSLGDGVVPQVSYD